MAFVCVEVGIPVRVNLEPLVRQSGRALDVLEQLSVLVQLLRLGTFPHLVKLNAQHEAAQAVACHAKITRFPAPITRNPSKGA
jgi:hypothetical protein